MPLSPYFITGEVMLALAALTVSIWALYDIMTYTPTPSPYVRRLQVKCLDHHDCN